MDIFELKNQRADGYYSFISYSTRDIGDRVKRFVDDYCDWLKNRGVDYIPVYIDSFYLPRPTAPVPYPNRVISNSLMEAIAQSDFTTCFIGSEYHKSPWCTAEFACAYELIRRTPHTPSPPAPHGRAHKILPIIIQQYSVFGTPELRDYLESFHPIDVSHDIAHGHWGAAVETAGKGTIRFLVAFYGFDHKRLLDW